MPAVIEVIYTVTGFFSVAYLTSFLSFVPVYFSFVSDSCSYPFCRLCLPLCISFPLLEHFEITEVLVHFDQCAQTLCHKYQQL